MAELQHSPISDKVHPHRYWRGSVEPGLGTGNIFIDARPPISLSLSPGGGVTVAYWEYSITPRSVIESAPSSAVWHKWPLGDIAEAGGPKCDAILGPVTAVRGFTDGGATVFEVTVHNEA